MLLTEIVNSSLTKNLITEADNKKNYSIEGPFIECDVKNKNGRIYPLPIAEVTVDKYKREMIDTNRALGELEHPETVSINPERTVIKISELSQQGNIFYGKAIVLDTHLGKTVLKPLMDENVKIGVSTRGLGSMKGDIVQSDFELIAIDVVLDPSAPSAFVDGIIESKKEWLVKGGIITEKTLSSYNKIKDKNSVKNAVNIIFSDFLQKITIKR